MMKLMAGIWALLLSFVPAMGLRSEPTTSQATQPVCPATGLYEDKDCYKVITGCACDVDGWVTWSSRPNCTGCKLIYNYWWTCTGPGDSGDTDGTQTVPVGCNTDLDINIDNCQCDGTSLISIGGHCGTCPGGN